MQKSKRKMENGNRIPQNIRFLFLASFAFPILISTSFFSFLPTVTLAQQSPETNINSGSFSLIVCDGPKLPDAVMAKMTPEAQSTYRPCNFRTAMLQIQHFLNIMLVLGVLAAIATFTWAGGLYISGSEKNITKARSMFPKIVGGFLLMLSAWFIVYEILSRLGNGSTTTLLK